MWEKQYTPPPQTTPTFEIQIQNKGIEDIMDIDSNCPHLLPVFGETTSHLTSKLNVMDGRTDRRGVSIFFNVENSIKREIRKNCYLKIHKKFKQHSINIKNYTAHPHDMVHVPAKFRENTSMRFWVTVRKLNVTDRQTDGRGTLQYLPSRAFGAAGDKKVNTRKLNN